MRRAKLGDVYTVKVPNGYKIIQWAYHIDKYGRFVRVFEGLYDKMPENISDIVAGPHSYITSLFVGRAYRIGLLNWIGNYPIPEQYPFPSYSIEFCVDGDGNVFCINLLKTASIAAMPHLLTFPVSTVDELPEEYRDLKLLNSSYSLDWLLYLFDQNYSLQNTKVAWPSHYWGKDWEGKYQIYVDMVEEAIKKDCIGQKSTTTQKTNQHLIKEEGYSPSGQDSDVLPGFFRFTGNSAIILPSQPGRLHYEKSKRLPCGSLLPSVQRRCSKRREHQHWYTAGNSGGLLL